MRSSTCLLSTVGVALGLIVESAVAVISVGAVVPEQVPAGIVHATEHSETATTRLFCCTRSDKGLQPWLYQLSRDRDFVRPLFRSPVRSANGVSVPGSHAADSGSKTSTSRICSYRERKGARGNRLELWSLLQSHPDLQKLRSMPQ
jgi:hypothetical protein